MMSLFPFISNNVDEMKVDNIFPMYREIAWDFEKNTVNSNVTLKAGWQLNEESEGLFDPETPMPY